MAETRTQFDYLLNALEFAAQADDPAKADYGGARRRLFAHVRELERDAERYRWLRVQDWDEGPMCVVERPRSAVKLGYDCPVRFRLDAAIDAARAAAASIGASGKEKE